MILIDLQRSVCRRVRKAVQHHTCCRGIRALLGRFNGGLRVLGRTQLSKKWQMRSIFGVQKTNRPRFVIYTNQGTIINRGTTLFPQTEFGLCRILTNSMPW